MTVYTLTTCPVCGGEAGTQIADRDDILREMELLWQFHGHRLRPEVPPARLLDRVVFSQEPPLRLVRCAGCGTILRHPRERASAVEERYATESVESEVLAALFDAQVAGYAAQARRLTRVLRRAGTGLEVGSYVGAFLAAARSLGWRFEGLDVNRGAVAFARERGLVVTPGTLDDVPPHSRFDAIAVWNCFEQLPDPRAAASLARERLVRGGILAVRVPNGAFYARLRLHLQGHLAGPTTVALALNNLLTFPYGHGFTVASLTRLLEDVGLRVVSVVGDVLVPTADRWTRPWAAAEERALKVAMRLLAQRLPRAAPWLEVYARA